jgi:nitrite reductase (NADH) small subunit
MREYVVGNVADIPEGGHVAIQIGRKVVAVFRVGGEFFAIHNRCAHKGGSLCDGILEAEERIVRCPWHHWDWTTAGWTPTRSGAPRPTASGWKRARCWSKLEPGPRSERPHGWQRGCGRRQRA